MNLSIAGSTPLTMPALTPSSARAETPAARQPRAATLLASPAAATGRRGVDQALEGVTMLRDPDLSFWPSFLSGKRWEDGTLPLSGRDEPGRLDNGVWVPHVRQGALGDCWFMGTLAAMALAKDPKWHPAIRRIDDETVALKFGDREVGLSDDLPTRRDGKLAYARPNGPRFEATWPVYYEKAAAAMRGSYRALDGGWPSEAFEMMFGTAPKRIDRPSDIIAYMDRAVEEGLPVAVTTRPNQTALMDEVNLKSNHTYAVRKIVTTGPRDGSAVYVKLWNPWGTEHPQVLTPQQFEQLTDSVTTPVEEFRWNSRRGILPS